MCKADHSTHIVLGVVNKFKGCVNSKTTHNYV